MTVFSEFLYKVFEKLCISFHIIKVYETKKGIKNFNLNAVSDIGDFHELKHLELSGDELFLGPDFLKDKFSLLDCPVSCSPHKYFMDALFNNENLFETDYIHRFQTGTLDWRRPYHIKDLSYWKNRFKEKYQDVLNDKYKPVAVYYKNGHYYIYDGKHRAALCSSIGKKAKCVEISDNCITGFYGKYLFKIIRLKKQYEKHKRFINS